MKMLTDWNCHLLPMMGEWITVPKDTRDALLLLNARTGIRRFCMMAEFDCGKDSLPGFLIARDRAMREIKPLLPEGFHVFAGGYIRLRPGISEISGLRKLCLPRTGLLPVLLPWAGLSRETALEWNRLLYHTSLHPLLMETDHFIRDGFSPENVKRLLRLEHTAYQFDYRSLCDPEIRNAVRFLIGRRATVLFGTAVNSPGSAAFYDYQAAVAAAEADFGPERLAAILRAGIRNQD